MKATRCKSRSHTRSVNTSRHANRAYAS